MLDQDEVPDQLEEAAAYLLRIANAVEKMQRQVNVIAWSLGILAALTIGGFLLTILATAGLD